METKVVEFDKIKLIAPVVNSRPIKLVYPSYDKMPSYCGAGKGFGDFIVPDTAYFLKISAACFYHDLCWDFAKPTWEEFHTSNSIFLSNINSIIKTKSTNAFFAHMRYYRAVTYFNAVDSIGAYYFWKLKRSQGYTGSSGINLTPPSISNKYVKKK